MLGAFVAFDTFAGKDLHINHGALAALVHAQRSVFHVAGFFAKNGAQQFFFGREGGFAFGRNLAHQHVARLHFSAHVDDARVVQTVELRFRQVGNIACDFFSAQLGITRHHHQFFDMDGGVAVIGHHALANQNRVLEVVAVPGHEGNQHVLADGDFAQIGRSTVSNHVALVNFVARFDDGALVDVGVLVATLVFDEVVDVYAHFARNSFFVIHAHHNAGGVYVVYHAATLGSNHSARVHRCHALNACANKWFFRAQHRHSLTRHVCTHQSAVGVVVLQERYERSSN